MSTPTLFMLLSMSWDELLHLLKPQVGTHPHWLREISHICHFGYLCSCLGCYLEVKQIWKEKKKEKQRKLCILVGGVLSTQLRHQKFAFL